MVGWKREKVFFTVFHTSLFLSAMWLFRPWLVPVYFISPPHQCWWLTLGCSLLGSTVCDNRWQIWYTFPSPFQIARSNVNPQLLCSLSSSYHLSKLIILSFMKLCLLGFQDWYCFHDVCLFRVSFVIFLFHISIYHNAPESILIHLLSTCSL